KAWATSFLVHQHQGGRHISSDAIAEDSQVTGVYLQLSGVFYDVQNGGVSLLNGCRIARLGRSVIVHEDNGGVRTDGQRTSQAIVSVLVAKNPTATVHVKYHRKHAFRLRPDDANSDRAGGPHRKGGVFDHCGQLLNGSLLNLDEHCPNGIRTQRVK